MTIQQVNRLFRTKYPNGEIIQKGKFNDDVSRVAVIFDKTIQPHRAYEYQYTSYVDLLNRLGFSVDYKRNIVNLQNSLAKMKDTLDKGYQDSLFYGKVQLTDDDKQSLQQRIKHYEEILSTWIFVD